MKFNEEQIRAIESDARYLMVLAGAGTGKTRTIIGRAVYLLRNGVAPQRIAILAFTRRAAAEIKLRLRDTVGEAARNVVAGTFHHMCLRIMRQRPQWFGYQGMTVLDRDDQLQLLRMIRSRIVGKNRAFPDANELLHILSYARNTNQGLRKYIETYTELTPDMIPPVLRIYEEYSKKKLENGYLDYDDILFQFATVLHENKEVRDRVCAQFEHLLVDEMQDTNPLQWLILESFAQHCNLFCVGDDAQSIYAFRGADFHNVHSFAERLPGAETLHLTLNYRSTQPILDLANWLLKASPLPYKKMLRARRPGGEKPKLLMFASELDEAEWIANEIWKKKEAGAEWSDHMILCRTAWTARPVEAALIEADIPYRFIGGMGLLQTAHVRDVLSVVRILVNYRDELAWMRYLTLFPGIGDARATRAINVVREAPDRNAALDLLDSALPQSEAAGKLLRRAAELESAPDKTIRLVSDQLESLLMAKYHDWSRRVKDLELLERMARKHKTLAHFLEVYTLDPVSVTEADRDGESNVVTLITVHSAKGTEAPVCFIVAAQAGNYPHRRSVGDPDAEEEERRVLYVAMTRAKDELIITRNQPGDTSRGGWHSFNWQPQPDFLTSLPLSLVDMCTHGYPTY